MDIFKSNYNPIGFDCQSMRSLLEAPSKKELTSKLKTFGELRYRTAKMTFLAGWGAFVHLGNFFVKTSAQSLIGIAYLHDAIARKRKWDNKNWMGKLPQAQDIKKHVIKFFALLAAIVVNVIGTVIAARWVVTALDKLQLDPTAANKAEAKARADVKAKAEAATKLQALLRRSIAIRAAQKLQEEKKAEKLKKETDEAAAAKAKADAEEKKKTTAEKPQKPEPQQQKPEPQQPAKPEPQQPKSEPAKPPEESPKASTSPPTPPPAPSEKPPEGTPPIVEIKAETLEAKVARLGAEALLARGKAEKAAQERDSVWQKVREAEAEVKAKESALEEARAVKGQLQEKAREASEALASKQEIYDASLAKQEQLEKDATAANQEVIVISNSIEAAQNTHDELNSQSKAAQDAADKELAKTQNRNKNLIKQKNDLIERLKDPLQKANAEILRLTCYLPEAKQKAEKTRIALADEKESFEIIAQLFKEAQEAKAAAEAAVTDIEKKDAEIIAAAERALFEANARKEQATSEAEIEKATPEHQEKIAAATAADEEALRAEKAAFEAQQELEAAASPPRTPTPEQSLLGGALSAAWGLGRGIFNGIGSWVGLK